MKYVIASEHKDFFRINRIIEFDDLISPDMLIKLNQEANTIIAERLESTKDKIHHFSSQAKFQEGRDLWRNSNVLKKCYTQLAEYASELMEQNTVRIGYDQYLPWIHASNVHLDSKNTYNTLVQEKRTLRSFTSIDEVICGVLICLQAPEKAGTDSSEIPTAFSSKAGSGVFFSPDSELNFEELFANKGSNYLLVVLVESGAVYTPISTDPFSNNLKHMGYIIGERLKDKTHPQLHR